ncbi:AAA family ATPase [Candidatus Woesearchaeota archaeon]|nr:AAA family ATPase [Candidatus Woesearchaeota archaeon]
MRSSPLPTGSAVLDGLLGSYPPGVLTMLYGPAGAGKSTCAFLAVLQVLSENSKAVYIDTERNFSPERLAELAGYAFREKQFSEVLSRILLMQPADLDAQCSSVASAAALARSARIGLIVVDTIGAHYRRARPSGAKDANALLRGQLDVLSAVAKETETMVLLTNQVFQRVEYGGVGIIGGAMLGQRCKCQVELQKDGRGRRAVLRRHPERQGDVSYDIAAEGIVAKRE